nr:hypothetical protein [Clostridioides sp.]
MAVDKKKFKEVKEVASEILAKEGLDHDTWIYKQYCDIIINKSDLKKLVSNNH